MSDITNRLDRLESLVEQQQETIEEQRERIAELEGQPDGDENPDETVAAVSRRGALTAGGLLALLVGGVGTASAGPQGQVGTSADPLQTLYTAALEGPITDDGSGPQTVSNLLGDGLSVDQERLAVAAGNGLGIDGSGQLVVPDGAIDNAALTNGSVTVDAGDGLTGGGSLSLGGSTRVDIAPDDFAGRNLTASGGYLDYNPPENVIVVAKSGGDYTTVSGALDSITDNTADNPYVIHVAPGVYNEQVYLKSHVDIVGSGVHATRIETSQSLPSNATLQANGATNVEVRRITIQGDTAAWNSGDHGTDVAIKQARLRQVGGSGPVIFRGSGTHRLRNCSIEAPSGGAGLGIDSGRVDMAHCYVAATYAVSNNQGTVDVRHSQLVGNIQGTINTFSVCDGDYNEI